MVSDNLSMNSPPTTEQNSKAVRATSETLDEVTLIESCHASYYVDKALRKSLNRAPCITVPFWVNRFIAKLMLMSSRIIGSPWLFSVAPGSSMRSHSASAAPRKVCQLQYNPIRRRGPQGNRRALGAEAQACRAPRSALGLSGLDASALGVSRPRALGPGLVERSSTALSPSSGLP